MLSCLGSYMTDTEEGPSASDHSPVSPEYETTANHWGKVHQWGITTADAPNCPLKEENSTNKHLFDYQSQYFCSPSALAALLCLCTVKEEAALEPQAEAKDFRNRIMRYSINDYVVIRSHTIRTND